ncbi:cell division protein FtsZ [candidate division WOR-3 bacterium]|nr:cell division protein FtsZ [candidate division WOR-3 bacterium]
MRLQFIEPYNTAAQQHHSIPARQQAGGCLRRIKVIGVGGGGCNAVNTMVKAGIKGIDFIATNTDIQALSTSCASHKVQIGVELTKGIGSGGNPEIGKKAIDENREEVKEMLRGSDMVIITCGMGGGTGTGASPVIAQLVKDSGALVVAIVTKPFNFEGSRRASQSIKGIYELKKHADAVIIIPNQKLLHASLLPLITKEASFLNAFEIVDQLIFQATKGIVEIITRPGLVNVDFADLRAVMSEPGDAFIAIGNARGEDRAVEAANQAINSPLLDDVEPGEASGILVNIIGGIDLTLHEVNRALSRIRKISSPDANIIFGVTLEKERCEEFKIIMIATGIEQKNGNQNVVENFNLHKKEKNLKIPAFIRKDKIPTEGVPARPAPTSEAGQRQQAGWKDSNKDSSQDSLNIFSQMSE